MNTRDVGRMEGTSDRKIKSGLNRKDMEEENIEGGGDRETLRETTCDGDGDGDGDGNNDLDVSKDGDDEN